MAPVSTSIANGHGAVLHVELVHALCQVFFQDALHGLINGEHQVVAILGLHILLILKGHIGAQGIAGGDQPPRGAPSSVSYCSSTPSRPWPSVPVNPSTVEATVP